MACVANIIPVVLDRNGVVLDVGYSARFGDEGAAAGDARDVPVVWCARVPGGVRAVRAPPHPLLGERRP